MVRTNIVYDERIHHHNHHHFLRKAAYSIILVGSVLTIGTLGMHYIENYSYIDSFYFVSMLATGEGPSATPATFVGKIFASLIAFVSVGTVLFSLAFLFGPFLTRLFKAEAKKLKAEEDIIEKEARKL